MSTTQPSGYDVTTVASDSDTGAFTTTWSDGRTSGPTVSIERAIIHRQRAKSIAIRAFLKRK